MTGHSDAVESYLDDLLGELRGSPHEVRRMLAEAETHLYAAVADGVARGLDNDAAAAEAVARFGPAAEVARAWSAVVSPRPFGVVARWLVTELLALTGVGLVAVGLSGLVARAMASLWGLTFMFADPPGTRYPASACRYWLAAHPGAGTCTKAYLAESLGDVLLPRYVAGIVGVLLLGTLVSVRRRRGQPMLATPPVSVSLTGAAVFLVATAGLLALGVNALRLADGNGAGQWLSGAAVALPMAVVYGLCLLRGVRRSVALDPASAPPV